MNARPPVSQNPLDVVANGRVEGYTLGKISIRENPVILNSPSSPDKTGKASDKIPNPFKDVESFGKSSRYKHPKASDTPTRNMDGENFEGVLSFKIDKKHRNVISASVVIYPFEIIKRSRFKRGIKFVIGNSLRDEEYFITIQPTLS